MRHVYRLLSYALGITATACAGTATLNIGSVTVVFWIIMFVGFALTAMGASYRADSEDKRR